VVDAARSETADVLRLLNQEVSAARDEALVAQSMKTRLLTVLGHELSFPIQGNPRLASASEEGLNAIELSPFGIHWPRLDEDLSFEGILRGNYGQK